MTRQFIRFYLGVVFILVAAWLVQSWLYGSRFAPVNGQVVRDAYFGGMRIARQKYLFGRERGEEEEYLRQIQMEYDFPVRLNEENPHWDFDLHLCRGVDHDFGPGTFIMARLDQGKPAVLLFGPLPRFAGPTSFEVLLGMGAVLVLTALGIALLLRPVVKQFQVVERTAKIIASGDLSARVEAGRGVTSSNLVRAFNNMAGRTEAMVRTQEELLQAVSHELRTPLSRIHFATDLVRTVDEDQREEKLVAIESAADDLDKIVGELMAYVRAEKTSSTSAGTFEIGLVIQECFRKQGLLFPDVVFQLGEECSRATVTADAAGFERAMGNLLSNAARFSKKTVQVAAQVLDGQLVIDVDDDGSGISEDDCGRVFQPFVRLSESGSGVGLGLAIVKRIVEQNAGSISVTASPLGGCRFRTSWPV